jgi:predicted DNA-binding antitoxin AbrB/MazE fold protein
MSIDVDAIYENGVLRPKTPLGLPERTEVHLTIETGRRTRTPLGSDLEALRTRAIAEGDAPLLDREGVIEAVRAVRGGFKE